MKTSEIKSIRGTINGQPASMVKIIDTNADLHSILQILDFEQWGEWYYKIIDSNWINIPTAAKLFIKEHIYNATNGRNSRTAIESEIGYIADPIAQMEWIDNVKDVSILSRIMNLIS